MHPHPPSTEQEPKSKVQGLKSKVHDLRSAFQRHYHAQVADKGFFEILHGTAWAMASRAGTTVLALISSLMITRLYGAESMGILALVTSILSIVTVFTVLGTGTAILRLIPEHLAKYSPTSAFHVYRKTQYLVAGVSVITGLILYFLSGRIASGIFNKPHLSGLVAASSGFVLFKSIMLLNQQAVRGLKLIRTYSVLQLLPYLALVLLLLAGLAWKTPALPAYAQLVAWAITGIAGAIIMDRAFRHKMQSGDQIQEIRAESILSISLPMLMTTSMQIIISQAGIIILGMHRPTAEVGYYAVAVRLATLTTFVLSAINTMSAPKFSELYHQGQTEELLRVARKSTGLIAWVTVPILAGLLILGKQFLHLFGPEFTIAYPALFILITGQFINSISGSTGLLMNMTNNHNQLFLMMMGAALINLTINLFLTPTHGLTSAAIAAAVSQIFWNTGALFFIYKRFKCFIGYIPFYATVQNQITRKH